MVPAAPLDGSADETEDASAPGTGRARRPGIHEVGRPDVTEVQIGRTTHKVAPVAPLDVSGVRTMVVGTVLWTIVAGALAFVLPELREDGRAWWFWTALAGAVLGVLGTIYCRRRVTALARIDAESR